MVVINWLIHKIAQVQRQLTLTYVTNHQLYLFMLFKVSVCIAVDKIDISSAIDVVYIMLPMVAS